ncbi:MAG: CotH kinase family protein, partial [Muribaculaceae bacterium]|nr:CotH kinase family protein [Muribaculaceae bacterium]
MKILHRCATFALLLISAISASASENMLYAVGPFNGWDSNNCMPFSRDDEGTFRLTLDFGSSREFKMSTEQGDWNTFDSGALKPVATPAIGEWTELESNPNGNIVAPAAERLTVEVDLDGMRMRYTREVLTPYSGTLPLLYIDTAGGQAITSKDTYVQATYYLDPMGHGDVPALGSADSPLSMQIRGRGNYTWTGFDKKPYRIKLADKQPMLGLTPSKHFVLLAHADDRIGFMRNTLGFAASATLGLAWTPEQRPVEVMLNGDYIGLYFLTENVRVDKNRVNVVEQADMATTDVDGGWLVEIDNYDSDPHVTVMEGSYPVWFTYKSPEELSVEQHDYLQTQMQSIQDAIDARDYAAFSRLVDPDALARYYIVQEMMNDYESFHGSCYLHRQRGETELWEFGPVWDFGSALFADNTERFIWDSPQYHQVWIGAIYAAFPEFVDKVRNIWAELLEAEGPETILAEGRTLAREIEQAAICNFRRWPAYG